MNPMVDMAFLLVSFFMLTTTFKTVEPVLVDKPLSTSSIKVPEKNIMKITIDPSGKIFFGIDNKYTRQKLLNKMGLLKEVEFNQDQIKTFGLVAGIGTPVNDLPDFLDMTSEEQRFFQQVGIPCLGDENQLRDWVLTARLLNPSQRVSVLADRDTPYEYVRCVINTLQDLRIYRFNLVTDLETTQ
jgi:biopolymer transport protein ExbD